MIEYGNRLKLISKEIADGTIEGVDFGPSLYCIARSPSAVLVWSSGHMYTSGRQSVYGESSLIGLPDRTVRFRHHPSWKTYDSGGRLKEDRIRLCDDEIIELFSDPDIIAPVADAVRKRQTLLIEGGGTPLRPARKLGADAYQAWLKEADRGFVMGPGARE